MKNGDTDLIKRKKKTKEFQWLATSELILIDSVTLLTVNEEK